MGNKLKPTVKNSSSQSAELKNSFAPMKTWTEDSLSKLKNLKNEWLEDPDMAKALANPNDTRYQAFFTDLNNIMAAEAQLKKFLEILQTTQQTVPDEMPKLKWPRRKRGADDNNQGKSLKDNKFIKQFQEEFKTLQKQWTDFQQKLDDNIEEVEEVISDFDTFRKEMEAPKPKQKTLTPEEKLEKITALVERQIKVRLQMVTMLADLEGLQQRFLKLQNMANDNNLEDNEIFVVQKCMKMTEQRIIKVSATLSDQQAWMKKLTLQLEDEFENDDVGNDMENVQAPSPRP